MEILAQALRAPQLASGMTVVEARRALTDAFRRAGLDSPELDARLLTGHALGLDHTGLVIEANRDLRGDEARRLIALAARRLEREPVARILGVKEFWGLPLRITESTLVPRPETETVVEAALAAIDQGGPRHRALRIADLGTGSGALLIALLTELPNATASPPTSASTRCSRPATMRASSCFIREHILLHVISARRCRNRSTSWCRTRPTS